MLGLTPHTFLTVDDLRSYMGKQATAEADVEDRCVRALNGAVAWMERFTGRKLKARNYRTAESVIGMTLVSSSSGDYSAYLSTGGLRNVIKAGDDVVGTVVPFGQQVDWVSNTFATCTRPFDSSVFEDEATLTFGSVPEYMNGTGTSVAWANEYPIVSVWNLDGLDSDNTTWSALDTSQLLIGHAGRLELGNDVFTSGPGRVRIEYRAGYEQPTNLTLGHMTEWAQLERAQVRLAEILFGDDRYPRGRMTSTTAGQYTSGLNDFAMPADVAGWLAPFRRVIG